MYGGDSFHTLTVIARIGLVVLSVTLSCAALYLAYRLMRHRPLVVRLVIGSLVFFSFVWLSPQIHYSYYLLVFDGLPLQNVIKAPPTPVDIFDLLTFRERTTLSAHSKSLLGWGLLALSLPGTWPGS